MKASIIQSFISTNANKITSLDAEAGAMKDRAAWFKQTGEMSFYYHELKKLGKVRSALSKAHGMQNELIRELKAGYARTQAISTIISNGFAAVITNGQTLAELQELAVEAVKASAVNARVLSTKPVSDDIEAFERLVATFPAPPAPAIAM